MFEGSMKSTGWGCTGTDEKGFEWLFTPDPNDPHYSEDPSTGECYPFCRTSSGDVFRTEEAAVRDGKKWMKKTGRSGSITAVKPTPRHFEY